MPHPGGVRDPAGVQRQEAGKERGGRYLRRPIRWPSPAPRPDSGNEIHITTNAASYAPGAAVGLSIHNATAHQFAFNPCTRHFEREAHGEVTEPNRMCTMEAWLLEPNGTRDASVSLPAVIEPGTYQVRIDFAAQDSSGLQVHAISNPFTVTP
jgi:hypothetical protein